MRANGITYDTGFIRAGVCSRPHFDPVQVKRELTVIRDDLHCTAVHITGGDPDRLESAARCAAELGLEVWFSPYPLELEPDDIRSMFIDCAQRAERLRETGAEIVFVTGVELSIMNPGFTVGDDVTDRVGRLLADPDTRSHRIAELGSRLNGFLAETVAAVRDDFGGKVTYAAIQFEQVDWDLFDIATFELMRSAEVADRFQAGVRALVAGPKPVAITGFGTATWRGSGDVAPRSMEIIEWDEAGRPVRLTGEYGRDEAGQAAYFGELLEIFDAEGVDAAFPFLLAHYDLPHRPDGDPRDDLDLAGFGIVKIQQKNRDDTYPDLPWEPKEAFATIARFYAPERST